MFRNSKCGSRMTRVFGVMMLLLIAASCSQGSSDEEQMTDFYYPGTECDCYQDFPDSSEVEGYIRSQRSAVKIADAILSAKFNESRKRPDLYHVNLEDGGVWHVYGTYKGRFMGGSLAIRLDAATGEVIEIYQQL